MKTVDFKKENLDYFGRWLTPVLAWELVGSWGEWGFLKKSGIDVTSNIIIVDGHAFFPKNVKETLEKSLKQRFVSLDKVFFKNLIAQSTAVLENYENLKTKSMEEFLQAYTVLECPWITAILVSDVLEQEIRTQAIRAALDPDSVVMSIAPARKSLSAESEMEMRKLHRLMHMQDKNIEKKIDAFVTKYAWQGTHHFWGEPLTKERLLTELNHVTENSSRPAMAPKVNADLRFLMMIAGELVWIRNQCAEVAAKVTYTYKAFLQNAAKAMDIGYDDLIWLTRGEIAEGLKKGKTIPLSEIEARKKGWGAVLEVKDTKIITGQELKKEVARLAPQEKLLEMKEIQGTVACKGYAKGIVRVVVVPHHVTDFKEGMILVAPETTPDYIALMKKSAAIVTDKGGITSHAAIVSRELGKPCIIGTKSATRVFKDGDMVEVNAKSGIVRLL